MLEAYFHSIDREIHLKEITPQKALWKFGNLESFITYISLLFIIGEQAKVHVDFPEKINTGQLI